MKIEDKPGMCLKERVKAGKLDPGEAAQKLLDLDPSTKKRRLYTLRWFQNYDKKRIKKQEV